MTPFLISKIEEIEVTESSLDYKGSITIDPKIAEWAGLIEYQQVQVCSKITGERAETYVLLGEPGDCQINGALSLKFAKFDKVHINAFAFVIGEIPRPKIVTKEQVLSRQYYTQHLSDEWWADD